MDQNHQINIGGDRGYVNFLDPVTRDLVLPFTLGGDINGPILIYKLRNKIVQTFLSYMGSHSHLETSCAYAL